MVWQNSVTFMSQKINLNRFLADPGHFLYSLEWRSDECVFINVSRSMLSDLPFLDNRILRRNANFSRFPKKDIYEALKNTTLGPINFLFHSAFCCSTLIARCLDVPGRNLSLKEPFALLGLSGYLRNDKTLEDADTWLHLALSLLGRRFLRKEQILIKPSNGANNILMHIHKHAGISNVVLLYGDLDSFLVSVLGSEGKHETYLHQLAQLFQKDFGDITSDISALSSLQKAVLVWGLQLKFFENITTQFPKIKTLDANLFLQNPQSTLQKLSRFYGLNLSTANLTGILESPAFTHHAKERGKSYSVMKRAEERQAILDAHASGIKNSHDWAMENGFYFPNGLPNPL